VLSARKKLGYSVLANVLMCLLGEGAARVYDLVMARPRPVDVRFMSNPVTIMEPHPYISYVANPEYTEHNQQGFRGVDEHTPDFQGYRIACLGGSSTYGTRVAGPDCYPRRLESLLADRTKYPVDVINGGLAGYSTHNLVGMLAFRIVPLKPDICIFYIGHNDAWNRISFADFRLDNSHAQCAWIPQTYGIALWRKSVLLNKVAHKLGYPIAGAPHIHQVCWKPMGGDPGSNWKSSSFESFRHNVATLIATCRIHGIRPIFCTEVTDFANHGEVPVMSEAMKDTAVVLKQLCEENSAEIVNLQPVLGDQEDYFADYLHLSSNGNDQLARCFSEWLTTRLIFEHEPRRR
jgi:lysophospholipase L1-like esterase